MKLYELTVIVKDEHDIDEIIKNIEILEGKITEQKTIGNRHMVYPIKKENSGIYHTFLFELNPEKLPALNRQLKQQPNLLRYLITIGKITVAAPPIILKTMTLPAEAEPLVPVAVSAEPTADQPIEKIPVLAEEVAVIPAEEKPVVIESPAEAEALSVDIKKERKSPEIAAKAAKGELPKRKPVTAPPSKPEIKPAVKEMPPAMLEPEKEAVTPKPAPVVKPSVTEVESEEEERLRRLNEKLDELLKE